MTETNDGSAPVLADEPESRPGGIPLYVWVLIAVVLAIPVGLFWREGATRLEPAAEAHHPRPERPWPRRWSCWRSSRDRRPTTSGAARGSG